MVPVRLIVALVFALLVGEPSTALAQSQCNGNFGAGQVCGNPNGSSGSPKATALSPVFDANFGSTANSILYRDGSLGWTALAASPSSILVTNGSGLPGWSASLPSGLVAGVAPITATVVGAATDIGLVTDTNFAVVANQLAFASIGAGHMLANSSSGSAEPTDTSWNAFANQAISTTQFAVPMRGASTWGVGILGGMAFVADPATVPHGGTGDTTFTANLPIIGNGTSALGQGTVTGNTTKFATSTGSITPNDCVKWDGNSNAVDAGATCGAGSNTPVNQSFTSPGTIATVTLTNVPLPTSAGLTTVVVDGLVQTPSSWSLNTGTGVITFSPSITYSHDITVYWYAPNTLAGVGSITENGVQLYGSTVTLTFANIAALTAFTQTSPATPMAYVAGYLNPGDGGGDEFFWNATSTATVDNCTIFGSGTGRWIRITHGSVLTPEMCGAQGDAQFVSDGAINATSTTLTSATANFTSADQTTPPKVVSIAGAGVHGRVGAINTITGTCGAGGCTPGVYGPLSLTGGSGTGATATITVNGATQDSSCFTGIKNPVVVAALGQNYLVNDTLSAAVASIGNCGISGGPPHGANLSINVASITSAYLRTTISSVLSSTQVTVAAAATTSVTGATVQWNTDDAIMWRRAMCAISQMNSTTCGPSSTGRGTISATSAKTYNFASYDPIESGSAEIAMVQLLTHVNMFGNSVIRIENGMGDSNGQFPFVFYGYYLSGSTPYNVNDVRYQDLIIDHNGANNMCAAGGVGTCWADTAGIGALYGDNITSDHITDKNNPGSNDEWWGGAFSTPQITNLHLIDDVHENFAGAVNAATLDFSADYITAINADVSGSKFSNGALATAVEIHCFSCSVMGANINNVADGMIVGSQPSNNISTGTISVNNNTMYNVNGGIQLVTEAGGSAENFMLDSDVISFVAGIQSPLPGIDAQSLVAPTGNNITLTIANPQIFIPGIGGSPSTQPAIILGGWDSVSISNPIIYNVYGPGIQGNGAVGTSGTESISIIGGTVTNPGSTNVSQTCPGGSPNPCYRYAVQLPAGANPVAALTIWGVQAIGATNANVVQGSLNVSAGGTGIIGGLVGPGTNALASWTGSNTTVGASCPSGVTAGTVVITSGVVGHC